MSVTKQLWGSIEVNGAPQLFGYWH